MACCLLEVACCTQWPVHTTCAGGQVSSCEAVASAYAMLPKVKSPTVILLVYVLQVYYTKVSP